MRGFTLPPPAHAHLPDMRQKLLAEFFGTFALVFVGTGSVVADVMHDGALGMLGIAVCFGFVVTAVIYAIGDLSGAHINPAVTIAFAVAGRFEWKDTLPYIVAQCLGSVSASIFLAWLFPTSPSYGQTVFAIPVTQAFALEVVLTFLLMWIVMQVATGSKEVGIMAGLAIGVAVMVLAAVGGLFTGASMNPARSFGPAIVGNALDSLWLYWTAPFVGAILAIYAWRAMRT